MKLQFSFLAAAVLLAFWWYQTPIDKPSAETFSNPITIATPPPIEQKVQEELRPEIKTPPFPPPTKRPPQPPHSTSSWPELPSPNHVRFEVVQGMAIAFGDVILGRVKDGADFQHGVYRPQKRPGLWPSREIAYVIDPALPNRQAVLDAIEYFAENTVMEFYPAQGEQEDLIYFTTFEKNCASYLGHLGGHQPIYLAKECGRDEIIHEVMHALGFVHEQSRIDRDSHLEILWENIRPGFENQFDLVPPDLVHSYLGSVFYFDYDSVMLYRPNAFAKQPGLETMRSLTRTPIPREKIGLSQRDIDRIAYLYR